MSSLVLLAMLSAAPTPYFWPKPEVVEEIDIPSVVNADGVPVRLHVIRSKKGVQQLLELFAQSFVNAGFYVAKVQKRHIAEPHVTGLDWVGLVSYTAILSPNGDGSTTCVLGEASLGHRKKDVGPEVAPLFPGAREVMRFEQEGARMVTYAVTGTTTDEVKKFYAEQLHKAGWQVGDDGAYERSSARLSVMPRPSGDGRVSVVLVLQP